MFRKMNIFEPDPQTPRAAVPIRVLCVASASDCGLQELRVSFSNRWETQMMLLLLIVRSISCCQPSSVFVWQKAQNSTF